nr:hypothetical protein [Halomarina sp. BND7]
MDPDPPKVAHGEGGRDEAAARVATARRVPRLARRARPRERLGRVRAEPVEALPASHRPVARPVVVGQGGVATVRRREPSVGVDRGSQRPDGEFAQGADVDRAEPPAVGGEGVLPEAVREGGQPPALGGDGERGEEEAKVAGDRVLERDRPDARPLDLGAPRVEVAAFDDAVRALGVALDERVEGRPVTRTCR